MLADDDDEATPSAGPSKGQSSQQPAWMRHLLERCREWLSQLPSVSQIQTYLLSHSPKMPFQTFNTLVKQSGDNQDPMYRLFFREGSVGRKLLSQVRKDLADVVKVCEGELKQTNHLRTLMSSLTKGMFSLRFHGSNSIIFFRYHPHSLAAIQSHQGNGRE